MFQEGICDALQNSCGETWEYEKKPVYEMLGPRMFRVNLPLVESCHEASKYGKVAGILIEIWTKYPR